MKLATVCEVEEGGGKRVDARMSGGSISLCPTIRSCYSRNEGGVREGGRKGSMDFRSVPFCTGTH